MVGEAVAVSNANVALAKYWGKRDEFLNLPYTGSISITLDGLTTTARVRFQSASSCDRVVMNGVPAPGNEAARIGDFLDLVRAATGESDRADVDITSTFPVAAGLASSASTFAALALAGSRAAGLSLSDQDLSVLARRGSGSAARSVFGGYVEWLPGEQSDGNDSYAVQLAAASHWDLGVTIAVTHEGPKKVGSREGMNRTVKQSPFFPAWLIGHEADMDAIRAGIVARDLSTVGRVAEHNCLKMHAVSIALDPPLVYWSPATVAVMQRTWQLREDGIEAYFTIDAGPQVKILSPMAQRDTVAELIAAVPGVQRVILSKPGAGVQLVDAR